MSSQALKKYFVPRNAFLLIPVLYIGALSFMAMERSSARASILRRNPMALIDEREPVHTGLSSKVQLEDFHRVEIKNGKTAWEISARDARYFPKEFVTHVNNAALRIFRDKKDDVTVSSATAKLYLNGNGIKKAILDGAIKIALAQGLVVSAESADFDTEKKIFSSDGEVRISGEGFDVRGSGFQFFVESGIVSFSRDVRCSFASQMKFPQGIEIHGQ